MRALLLSSFFSMQLFLFSCGNQQEASTEVENEIRLTGIAATGIAAIEATVDFHAPDGTLLGRTLTDSMGAFAIVADRAELQGPVLIHVRKDTTTLYTLLYTSLYTSLYKNTPRDSLFALANPITTQVVRHLLGNDPLTGPAGFTSPDFRHVDSLGNAFIIGLFGRAISWEDFYTDPQFRPYNTTGRESTGPHDALLHTLGDEARRMNQSLGRYLDSLFANPPPTPLLEQDFRFQLTTNLVLLGVDSNEAREKLRIWQPGDPRELEDYYDALRDSKNQAPPPPDSQSAEKKAAWIAVENALRIVPGIYQGTDDYTVAMNNLPALSEIALSLVSQALSPLKNQNLPPDAAHRCSMYNEEIASRSVQIITCFQPEKWQNDRTAIQRAAETVLRDSIIRNFDIVACVQNGNPEKYYHENYSPWQPGDQEWCDTVESAYSNRE